MTALLLLIAITLPNFAAAADILNVTKAAYDAAKQELRIEATSTDANATITAFVTSTNALIGTLTNNGGGKFSGRFSWPVNPGSIDIRSSSGGLARFQFPSEPAPAPPASADFLVGVGLGSGFLVRGGFPSCPAYYGCFGGFNTPGLGWEPRTLSIPELGFAGYSSNQVQILARNGFTGTVTLQVLNLSPGVTSQTATSLTVAANSSAATPFMLQAGGDAPLGDHIVTVRATSGALVHDATFTITIVDHLPAPPAQVSMDTGFLDVVGGGRYAAAVTISAPAPAGGLIAFLSVEGIPAGDPTVVTAPASVTIPEGATSASFTVTTPPVTAIVGQSVLGKIGADGWLGSTTLRMVPTAALS